MKLEEKQIEARLAAIENLLSALIAGMPGVREVAIEGLKALRKSFDDAGIVVEHPLLELLTTKPQSPEGA